MKLWVFNETPQSNPIVFQFRDANNIVQYTFDFHLNFTGWRAAWIAYSDMWTPGGGKTSPQDVISMEIVSPENVPAGKLWFDRIEFAVYVDRRATPDAQIPENNRHLNREIWHWGYSINGNSRSMTWKYHQVCHLKNQPTLLLFITM